MSNLTHNTTRWRKMMQDVACGPLIIAKEIEEVGANWLAYKEEAGGLSFTQWCTQTFGSQGINAAFWSRRARAVDVLGEAIRRRIHHEVAVWILNRGMSADDNAKAVRALYTAYKENGEVPLNLERAMPIVFDVLKIPKVPYGRCPTCGQRVKIEPVEYGTAAELNELTERSEMQ